MSPVIPKHRRLSSLRAFVLVCTAPLAACGGDDTAAVKGELPQGIAVVNSDYKSASVSLLDPATNTIVTDNCITSGVAKPGLSLALSSDVSLPSAPQPGNELLLLDRGNAALVWLDPKTCAVKRQLAVGTKTYMANPHDVVGLSATKAYVLRYERNEMPTADAADLDEGDDILVIDPTAAVAQKRIPLASYASNGTVWARPDRAAVVDGKVYVALDNLSSDFTAAGEGRLVVIDPATDAVTGTIDIPGLKNCNGLDPIPGTKTLVVTCGGAFSDADQAAASGIVSIDLGVTPPVVTKTLTPAPFMGLPISAVAATGATTGFAVTFGAFKPAATPDRLWTWNATTGTAAQLAEATGAFVLGTGLWDEARKQMLVPDATATAPGVHVYDIAAAPVLKTKVVSNPASGLPPRALGWY